MSPAPVRLFIDECVQQAVLEALRSVGLDVMNAREQERLAATDSEQLEFAASQQRALFSTNVDGDFQRLHVEWLAAEREHWGIVLSPEYKNVRELIAACRYTFGHCYPDDSYTRNSLLWIQKPKL